MSSSPTGKHFSAGMDHLVFTGGDVLTEGRMVPLAATATRWGVRGNSEHRASPAVILGAGGACPSLWRSGWCGRWRRRHGDRSRLSLSTEDAWFCIQEINIGMTADVGMQRLQKLIPDGVCELAYTGDRSLRATTKEVGLVNEVYATDTMLEHARYRRPYRLEVTAAVYGSKRSIVYARDHSVADRSTRSPPGNCYVPARDMMESFQAQMEKREPEFDDLNPVQRGQPWFSARATSPAHERGRNPTAERPEVVVEWLPSASRSSSSSYEPS